MVSFPSDALASSEIQPGSCLDAWVEPLSRIKAIVRCLLSLTFYQRLYRAQNQKRRLSKRTRMPGCLPWLLSCCCQDRERLTGMSPPGSLKEGEFAYTDVERIGVWSTVRESLSTKQHALTQEIKLSPSIHLSFDGLEFVDFAFGLPIAFRATQCRFNGRQISLHPVGQLNKLRDGTAPSASQPCWESFNSSLTKHFGEGLSQLEGESDIRVQGRGTEHFLCLLRLQVRLHAAAPTR